MLHGADLPYSMYCLRRRAVSQDWFAALRAFYA